MSVTNSSSSFDSDPETVAVSEHMAELEDARIEQVRLAAKDDDPEDDRGAPRRAPRATRVTVAVAVAGSWVASRKLRTISAS